MTTANLAEKLEGVDAQQRAGAEIEPRQKTVFDLIRDQQSGFARALPSMITPERFVRVAVSVVRNNPKLAQCDPMSLLGALMLSAQLGLEPSGPGDPRGHAYLVPYGRECTFIIGYKGYMDLARRSGEIASIEAEAVFEGDEFSWELGLHRDLVHRPTATVRTDYSKLTHVYAVAWLKDADAKPIFVVLTKEQVESFRKRSKSAKGPWSTDPIPMAVKTGVRRLATWLPMSVEIQRALGADERVVDRIDVNVDDFIDIEPVDDDPPTTTSGDANLGERGRSGGTPPPDANESDGLAPPSSDVPPAGATDDKPDPETAAYMLDEARKEHPDLVKKFMTEKKIPNDSRKWTAEQITTVIDWIREDPEEPTS